MFATHTANLPPEQQRRLHPEFLANEQAYLRLREHLLARYRGQWVAVQNDQVIAAGNDLHAVTQAADAGGHPCIALVGAEDAVVFRVRTVQFAYDTAYQPFVAENWDIRGSSNRNLGCPWITRITEAD